MQEFNGARDFKLPKMRTDKYYEMPLEMQMKKQWIVWKFEKQKGKEKPTKVPYQINGLKASSNNPTTWGAFEEVVKAARSKEQGFDGIGFMFAKEDEFIGIDIDHCHSNGVFNEVAQDVMELVDSYTEFSPSGSGVHIIIKGTMPDYIAGTGKKSAKYGLEVYSYGRFFTCTGNRENENEVQNRTDGLEELFEKYFTREELATYTGTEFNKEPINFEDDNVTWQKMFTDKRNGLDIQAMYRGEIIRDNDYSSTDYYLCSELAYYCDKDFIKMDRMFRNSGLMREKWDELRGAMTYGERTLIQAAAKKSKTISDYKNDQDDFQVTILDDSNTIPKNYISKNGYLYRVVEKEKRDGEIETKEVLICRQTPVIEHSYISIEHPQLFHEIKWNDNGKIHRATVAAGDLAIKKELLKLSYQSLAVTDINAKELIYYFDRMNMENKAERQRLSERLGNIKGMFIHPLIANEVKVLPSDLGEQQLFDAFQISGTVEDWIKNVFEPIRKHRKALLMLIASFTSIILQDLKMKPFIVDLSGVTSQGKTTVLRACASVWGNEYLVSEWNLTKVAAERKASFLNSFPLILDDTRKADERQLQSFIYNFSGGRSKGRGSITGSQQEFTWGNLMLSTGEDSLNSYAERAGGVAARILPITGLPFENEGYEFFSKLYNGIESYYGAIGLAFLEKWSANKTQLLSKFNHFNQIMQQKAQGNEIVSRIARNYAAVTFTAYLLNSFFNLNINLNELYSLFDEMTEENQAIDKPMQLLEAILSDLDADRSAIFANFYIPSKEIKAIYKDGSLYLLPKYLKTFLKAESTAIRSEWLRRGISIGSKQNNKWTDYRQIKHRGQKYRGVAINSEIVEQLGFDFIEKNEKGINNGSNI